MRANSSGISALAAKFTVLVAAMILMAVSSMAQVQATAADLIGTVTDPNGAVVPGATVHARNVANEISRTVTADDQGEYQIIGLPPGEYEVTAEAATFKKVVISPVRLALGQRAELTIKLEVGAAEVAVVEAPVVEELVPGAVEHAAGAEEDGGRVEEQ